MCLINNTLSSIPLYYLSLFKMPPGVITICNQILRRFLWGGPDVSNRSVAWVCWEEVCKPKIMGGLGIKNWEGFNRAMLSKWRWRLCSESGSLWARIISAKYNVVNGRIRNYTRRHVSSWWRDIQKFFFEPQQGAWLDSSLSLSVGKGNRTSFWHDNWSGPIPLASKFNRLFTLSTQQNASIQEVGSWRDDSWVWHLSWRRELRDREKAWLQELVSEIGIIQLKKDASDCWKWLPCLDGFSVSSAYSTLSGSPSVPPAPVFKHVWQMLAPSNTKAFVWRVMWDRIQTRSNLYRRSILATVDDLHCPFCHREIESTDHLLLSYSYAYKVWSNCSNWLGIISVFPKSCREHFLQFPFGTWNSNQRLAWWSLWSAVVWSLWSWRNKLIFQHEVLDWSNLLEIIQWRSWSWITTMNRDFRCSLFEWTSEPRACIAQIGP